jgi:hypothetical protein
MFTGRGSLLMPSWGKREMAEQIENVDGRSAMHRDVGLPRFPLVLVARDLANAVSEGQRSHHHFLFDRGAVGRQPEPPEDICA